ncbi:protease complex subunit PrcB family protein [Natranaerobius trueperi]|uniref:PrcB C-terminal domain-containing protein n=1 Tax=Natranaerobius trueperi TaxID=759412 RepID=A0A226C3B3_9FIRM|nr:protease complex subunit PrcB family protein [Natranaerobius trueperi]OWZ84949.1 hypothetical protein CDO51_00655 [Natranaerobius trueperi]
MKYIIILTILVSGLLLFTGFIVEEDKAEIAFSKELKSIESEVYTFQVNNKTVQTSDSEFQLSVEPFIKDQELYISVFDLVDLINRSIYYDDHIIVKAKNKEFSFDRDTKFIRPSDIFKMLNYSENKSGDQITFSKNDDVSFNKIEKHDLPTIKESGIKTKTQDGNNKLVVITSRGEKSTGGYSTEITQVTTLPYDDKTLLVIAKTEDPDDDKILPQVITYPQDQIIIDSKYQDYNFKLIAI